MNAEECRAALQKFSEMFTFPELLDDGSLRYFVKGSPESIADAKFKIGSQVRAKRLQKDGSEDYEYATVTEIIRSPHCGRILYSIEYQRKEAIFVNVSDCLCGFGRVFEFDIE